VRSRLEVDQLLSKEHPPVVHNANYELGVHKFLEN
jgi:hypothetical protein